jgi:AbrB family looped-hinge helix DNA binding protein
MRVTAKGQVTIPVAFREALGLGPDTEVEFELVDGAVILRRSSRTPARGHRLIEQMLKHSEGKTTMSTDELMALMRGEA